MSIRSEKKGEFDNSSSMKLSTMGNDHVSATISAAQSADSQLGEANSFASTSPDHPLTRTVVASIRASLSDLCLRRGKSTWAPTAEALRSILQQKKFTDVSGSADACGDLRSIVLHDMSMASHQSNFPIDLGVTVTGVDSNTFSLNGDAYATVLPALSKSQTSRKLQADDVALAYEFSRKFPGYTAENLTTKGVHEVAARRFCLVAADHPIVSAIQENADKLQMGDISMMPEGLVKIGTDLYQTILPMVKGQVESQIKVRDLSAAKISIYPATHASWSDARTDLVCEKKTALRAELETELGHTTGDSDIEALRNTFNRREREIETSIDNEVFTFSCTLDVAYNFLSK